MKIKKLLIHLGIPILVGGLSAFICRNDFSSYRNINKPPLAPPAIVFPIVWTILYVLMGYSSFLISESDVSDQKKKNAYIPYGIQLFLNFLWSPIFFIWKKYYLAFLVLIVMYYFIWQMTEQYKQINYKAGQFQIPYAIWTTFALYLNLMVMILN